MKRPQTITITKLLGIGALALPAIGCNHWSRYFAPNIPHPLGAQSDHIWQTQQCHAEAAKFTVYQHEFVANQARLNTAGEDHVKQIAMRLQCGEDFPVVVERGMLAKRENTEFHYPVHPDPELDLQRREIIVRSLAAMGVHDAEERVVVAPSYPEGYMASEAERSYQRAIGGYNSFGGGGGFFGGGFGGGGFGGAGR
ncbi:MAG: hypothetical protein KDA42_03380 [Planctomycetales bacterium]|nr:hypothetical protein [Planctomycetales bacterium]